MIETLLGGLFGGALRLAPELLKIWDRKDERKHELDLLDREFQFAKTNAEIELHKADTELSVAQLDTLTSAFQDQAQTAQAAGGWVTAASALVRPLVTYVFIALYALVKIAGYVLAVSQGGSWDTVLLGMWSIEDTAVLNMILSFWFVGRVYERGNK